MHVCLGARVARSARGRAVGRHWRMGVAVPGARCDVARRALRSLRASAGRRALREK